MRSSLWSARKQTIKDERRPPPAILRPAIATRDSLQGPTRRRSRSKREKDLSRLDERLERKRLFKSAFHDNISSLGEIDALTGSEPLNVDRGDVLRDPKVKGYVHPSLRRA